MKSRLALLREKYPEYKDVPGKDLLKKIHSKHYPDMSYNAFVKKVSLTDSENLLIDTFNGLAESVSKIDDRGRVANEKVISAVNDLVKKISEITNQKPIDNTRALMGIPEAIKKSNSANAFIMQGIVSDLKKIVDSRQPVTVENIMHEKEERQKSFEIIPIRDKTGTAVKYIVKEIR